MKIKLLFTHFNLITDTIYEIIHATFNIYLKATKNLFLIHLHISKCAPLQDAYESLLEELVFLKLVAFLCL